MVSGYLMQELLSNMMQSSIIDEGDTKWLKMLAGETSSGYSSDSAAAMMIPMTIVKRETHLFTL